MGFGHDPHRDHLFVRMMKKVRVCKDTGCWEWQSATAHGYGILARGWMKSPHRASRLSFEFFNGPIPDGHVVRHRCDNRSCINPEHLETGTQKDNMRDMVRRGRMNPKSHQNLHPGAPGHHGAGPLSNKELIRNV